MFAQISFNLVKRTCTRHAKELRAAFIRNKTHFPLMLSVAHCLSEAKEKGLQPIKFADRPLTHEHLIHQACSDAVNSATQLLTQTLVAVLDIGKQYREATEEYNKLLNESIVRTYNDLDQNDINDLLVEVRQKVTDLNRALMDLDSLMQYVVGVGKTTADAAFIAGAEAVCNALNERLLSAQEEVNNNRQKNKILEQEILKLQKDLIRATAETEKKKKK